MAVLPPLVNAALQPPGHGRISTLERSYHKHSCICAVLHGVGAAQWCVGLRSCAHLHFPQRWRVYRRVRLMVTSGVQN